MKNPVQRRLQVYQLAAALGFFLISSALQAHPTPDWLLSATTDWLSLPDLNSLQNGGIALDPNLHVSPLAAPNATAHPSLVSAGAVLSHGNALDPAVTPGPVTKWTFPQTGNWFDPYDWSNGIPSTTSTALVANGGTAVIEESESEGADAEEGVTAEVGNLIIGSANGAGGTVIVGFRGALDIFNSLTVYANGLLRGTSGTAAFIFNDGTVTNSGTITGATRALVFQDGGTVLNNAGGVIEGSGEKSIGIQGLTAPVDITNFGNISGSLNAITLGAGGTITNDAGGSITATTGQAILITGGNETITNLGTITGGDGIAIDARSSSGNTAFTNSATINGNVELGGGTNTVTLVAGGIINGNLNLGANSASGLVLEGSGQETLTQAVTGTITDPGSLTKQGNGAWIINENLSAPVSTDVVAGTLTVAPNATLTSSTVTIGPSGILTDTGTITGNVTNSGLLTDAGTVTGNVTNSGLLTDTGTITGNVTNSGLLTDAGTITGNVTNSGSLTDTGTITGNVTNSGLLTGTGTISGNVTNSGTISPGDPFGTLTIRGNYTQSSSGVFRLELGGLSPGEFGLLDVTGHATLNGTLKLIRTNNFQFLPGDKLVFLTASSVTGSFSTVQNLNTIVTAKVVLLPDAVEIVATQGNFVSAACNPNSLAVAKALDSAIGDPRASALITFLDEQPFDQLCADFTLISPEDLTAVYALGVSLANIQTANLERHLEDIRSGSRGFSSSGFTINGSSPSFSDSLSGPTGSEGKSGPSVLAPIPENRWGFFATGLGDFTDVSSADGARGFNFRTGGVTLGVDYRIGSNFAIGLTGGYAHTGVDLPDGGSIDVDGGTGGFYATAFGGGFYLDTAVTGGESDYETHRTALMGTANGSTSSGTVNVLVAGGYDWTTGPLTIGPTASFQYTYVGLDGFTETGSLAPLKFGDQSVDSIRSALGIKASYDWKVGGVLIRPELRLSWQHEYGDSTYSIVASLANGAGNSFSVSGPPIGRDSLLVGAGVAILWNDRISTYIYYDGELARTNYDSQSVSGGFRITF
jgi:outer membrane autotransporter protein